MEDTEAFLICIRLGLTQARHWAATEEAWIYEAPVPAEVVSCSTEGEMVKVMEKIAAKGHEVIPNFRGGLSGHRCTRCDLFRCQASYAYWSEGPICTPKASSLERKEDFLTDQLQKRRKTEEVAIMKWKTESVAVEANNQTSHLRSKKADEGR